MSTSPVVQEFRKRLTLTHGNDASLALYLEYLPAAVEAAPSEAIVMVNEAQQLLRNLRLWETEPDLWRHRAAAHLRLGNVAAAEADLQLAYGQYAEFENRAGMARTSVLLASVELGRGRHPLCSDLLERACIEALETSPTVRADVLDARGRHALAISDYAAAVAHLRDAFALREAESDHAGMGRALSGIGIAFAGLKDLDAARDHHSRSLEEFCAANDVANQIRSMANLASVDRERGMPAQALDTIERAYALCMLNGDAATAVWLRMMIGDIRGELGERDVALQHYLEAYRLLEHHPTDELLLGLYHRIGGIHQAVGDPDAARHVFVQALGLAERIGDRHMAAQLHEALSGALEMLGEFPDALQQYKEYARLREEIAGEESRRAVAAVQQQHEWETIRRERLRAEKKVEELRGQVDAQREELADALATLARSGAALQKLKVDQIQPDVEENPAGEQFNENVDLRSGRTKPSPRQADHEWRQIERRMESLHPGFIERLGEACNNLTRTEVKICVLTRLERTTNEIAEALWSGHRTVQTQRLKIRRKFDLPGSVDFTEFIRSL
ncbi:MAG: tetratricopeptide repeat protein [Bacteroidetes bacterium]|nr:tetratricopeptide repeat protein [Bacteroidota bacterium]